MNLLKSIGSVFTGIIAIVLLSTGTDFVLENFGVFPPVEGGQMMRWMLALAFFYRTIYGVAGGYITATLAPSLPMRHAVILGIIGTLASLVGAIVGWNLSAHWYPMALVITALPTTWLGAKLKKSASNQ
jgi:hypothetical protein